MHVSKNTQNNNSFLSNIPTHAKILGAALTLYLVSACIFSGSLGPWLANMPGADVAFTIGGVGLGSSAVVGIAGGILFLKDEDDKSKPEKEVIPKVVGSFLDDGPFAGLRSEHGIDTEDDS